MKTYPALDVEADAIDLILARVDDFGPTGAEERHDAVRIFFANPSSRDSARDALTAAFRVASIDVPDEDWARRSQANLKPIAVGRITVSPNPQSEASPTLRVPNAITVVIKPSMGFGTGHHATTRLCLAALQTIDLTGKVVLDAGTGSGVVAIAADRLGAARVLGIDNDSDAIQSARENLVLNPQANHVAFELVDLTARPLPPADVIVANLTAALIVRASSSLLAALRPGGTLIVSGLLTHERDQVCRAFSRTPVIWEQQENGWVGLGLQLLH